MPTSATAQGVNTTPAPAPATPQVRTVRRNGRKVKRVGHAVNKGVRRVNKITGGAKETVGVVGRSAASVGNPNTPPLHLIASVILLSILAYLFLSHPTATTGLINGLGNMVTWMTKTLLGKK
jgi:hypothetical protein